MRAYRARNKRKALFPLQLCPEEEEGAQHAPDRPPNACKWERKGGLNIPIKEDRRQPPTMEGVFITAAPEGSPEESFLSRRPLLRQAADACFCYLLALFLVAVYFTMMSHTVYKNTNEFAGNQDFYVSSRRRL